MPLCQHSYGLLPGLIKKSLHDKYNASKGYHFGWLNLPETPNIFVLAPSLGLTHKKNKSNHAQGAYLFTVLCACMTLFTAPLYKLGLLNFWLWPISSLLIHPFPRPRIMSPLLLGKQGSRSAESPQVSVSHTSKHAGSNSGLPRSAKFNTPSVIQLHLMTQTLKAESNCTISEWANSEYWKSIIMDASRATTDWLISTVKVSSNYVKLHFIYRSGFSAFWIQVIVINNNPASCQHSSKARSNPCIARWARLINPRQIKWS